MSSYIPGDSGNERAAQSSTTGTISDAVIPDSEVGLPHDEAPSRYQVARRSRLDREYTDAEIGDLEYIIPMRGGIPSDAADGTYYDSLESAYLRQGGWCSNAV